MASRTRGITLIELLVVMSIIAILLTFVGPSISAGLDNLLLTTTGQRTLAAFKMAQTSARSSGQRVFAVHEENALKFLRNDRVFQTIALPAGIEVVEQQPSVAFVFLETGQIVGPDSLELMNSRGRRVRVAVDRARRAVRLIKENGGG